MNKSFQSARTPIDLNSNKISKKQLVENMSLTTGLTKRQSGEIVNLVLQTIIQSLQMGTPVGLPGLGTFTVRDIAPRRGVNPISGEPLAISATKRVRFKAAPKLKNEL